MKRGTGKQPQQQTQSLDAENCTRHTCMSHTRRKGVAVATALTSWFRGIIEEMMTEWMARTMLVNILTLLMMEGVFCLPELRRIVRAFRGVHGSLNIRHQRVRTAINTFSAGFSKIW